MEANGDTDVDGSRLTGNPSVGSLEELPTIHELGLAFRQAFWENLAMKTHAGLAYLCRVSRSPYTRITPQPVRLVQIAIERGWGSRVRCVSSKYTAS